MFAKETHTPEILAALREYRHTHVSRSTQVCAFLAVAAFVGFALIDPFLVADGWQLIRIRWARACIVIALLGTWTMARQGRESRWTHASGAACCVVIGVGVSVVTVMCGGADTRYHDALAVTFLAYAAFFPSTLKRGIALFSSLLVFHVMLQVVFQATGSAANFWTNLGVLVLAAFLSNVCIWAINTARVSEVKLGLEKARLIERLTSMDVAKNAFFANVSHELRTPLMLIIASMDSVQEQNVGDLKIGQQMQVGRRNGLRLLRLVDDLLELSKLESDTIKLRWSEFDLTAFVRELVEQTRALAERKGITLTTDFTPCDAIVADQHQVERVVLNLLANAIKFTGVGGTIMLRVRPERAGVAVDVADTGEGISAEALPRIFERFYQANLTSKVKRGGVGIGLSLCKRIVELHGGQISAASLVGRGTTLSFWLPLRGVGEPDVSTTTIDAAVGGQEQSSTALTIDRQKTSPLHEVAHAGAEGQVAASASQGVAAEKGMPEWDQALRERPDYRFFGIQEVADRRNMPRSEVKNDGPSILVVDDNRDMVEFLISILGADHQVWAAADGEDGLAMARRHRPDLIVSDLVMPRKSGLDFLREVRLDPDLKSIPFVLLTARGQEGDRRESDEAQADAFLPKPFLAGDLRPIIQRLLHKQDSQGRELQDANILALRMMAAGIAHDILNPVGFVKNALGILSGVLAQAVAWVDPAAHPVEEVRRDGAEFMHSAEEGVERIVAAVGELRRFARGEVSGERVPVDVNDAVNRVIGMTRPHGVFHTDLKAVQRPLLRHGQLEQVLLNLVLNALQAGGNNCHIDIATRDEPAERMLAVQVKDAGPGMDAATLARIFDPYFTTKKTGTGLGLTMCRQIIRDHGGRLEVDSRPGGGTVFTITLPFADPSQETPHV